MSKLFQAWIVLLVLVTMVPMAWAVAPLTVNMTPISLTVMVLLTVEYLYEIYLDYV